MLKLLRKMERTRNFLIILFAVMLVVSLIVFGALTGTQTQQNLNQSTEVIADVGSEEITVGEVSFLQDRILQTQQRSFPTNLLLNGIIRDRLVRIEAERLGLAASDAEVATQIRKIFTPTDGTSFDQTRYEQNARTQAGSVSAFEESIRNQISERKLNAFITAGVTASEAEVLKTYKRRNTKFDLTYVPVSTADLTENINPSDEELKKYFEDNKKNYYVNQSQKKIRYIFLDTAKLGEKLVFTDEELKAEYDKLSPDRKEAGVNVQEIVLRVLNPQQDSSVLDKANKIAQSLKKDGETVSEEKFANTASGQSEKPATALKGGRVTGLVRRNLNNSSDPYQRILNMKEGEVSEPIKFGTSYYVLRRGKSVPKTFEVAKKELEVSRRNAKAYTANSVLAGKVVTRLKELKDVQKVAEEFATQANMDVKNMVRETGYVKPGDEIDKLGISQDFEQGIAPLENPKDVGGKFGVPGGFAIPLLVDKKPPRDARFEEVSDKVKEAVKLEQARNKIEEVAKSIAKNAKNESGLSSAAKAEKFEALDANDFILGSPLGQGPTATTSEALEDAIFSLRKDEITIKPVKVGDNWYIVGVKSREEANMENFDKEHDQLVQTMVLQKRSRVFLDYIASVRRRMESGGQIKIYKAAVEKLDAQARQNQPQVPQIPRQQIPLLPQPPPQGN